MGKEAEGATEPGSALADSQKHMNAASGPMPPLADGILDLCSSPDASPAPKVTRPIPHCMRQHCKDVLTALPVECTELRHAQHLAVTAQTASHLCVCVCVWLCVCVCVWISVCLYVCSS